MLTIILCSWKSIECPSDCDSARSAVALQCVREDLETKDTTIIDHSYCSNLSRPNDLECSSACLAFSAWSEVSKSIRILPKASAKRNVLSYFQCCRGQAHQHRTMECMSSPINGIPINDKHCQSVDKHSLTRTCNINDCPVYYDVEQTSVVSCVVFLLRTFQPFDATCEQFFGKIVLWNICFEANMWCYLFGLISSPFTIAWSHSQI